jgi:hypothetical protein
MVDANADCWFDVVQKKRRKKLAPLAGLEPATLALGGPRATIAPQRRCKSVILRQNLGL